GEGGPNGHLAWAGRGQRPVGLARIDRDSEVVTIPGRQGLRVAGLQEHAADPHHSLHGNLLWLIGMVRETPRGVEVSRRGLTSFGFPSTFRPPVRRSRPVAGGQVFATGQKETRRPPPKPWRRGYARGPDPFLFPRCRFSAFLPRREPLALCRPPPVAPRCR